MKIKWIVGGLLLTAGIVMLFVLDIVTGDVSVNDIWSDCDIKFQNGGRIATTVDCINTKIVSTSEPQGMDVWQHPKLTKYNLFAKFSILKEGVMRDQAYHEHEWKIQQQQRENQRRMEGYHTIQSVIHLRGGIGTVPVVSDTRLQFIRNI